MQQWRLKAHRSLQQATRAALCQARPHLPAAQKALPPGGRRARRRRLHALQGKSSLCPVTQKAEQRTELPVGQAAALALLCWLQAREQDQPLARA